MWSFNYHIHILLNPATQLRGVGTNAQITKVIGKHMGGAGGPHPEPWGTPQYLFLLTERVADFHTVSVVSGHDERILMSRRCTEVSRASLYI